MAYRFDGVDDLVTFDPAPLVGYAFGVGGPYTVACLVELNADVTVSFTGATSGTPRMSLGWSTSGTNSFQAVVGVSARAAPGTLTPGVWYIVAATFSGTSGDLIRSHVYNGTAWTHSNYATGVTAVAPAVVSGDSIRAGHIGTPYLNGDMVCAAIKKADSSDAAVEALSYTLFQAWIDYGFDWLVGFQSAGTLADQGTASSGDETSRVGTTLVSDPPGWTWPTAGPATFYGAASWGVTFAAVTAGVASTPVPETLYGAVSRTVTFSAATSGAVPLAVPLEDPDDLTVTRVSETELDVTWEASPDGAVTGYLLERATEDGGYVEIATPAGTSYSDTGLAPGTGYTYRVRARDAAGNVSGYTASFTEGTTAPPPGVGVSLAPGSSALSATPGWQRIDLDYNVQSWSIDRGRQNEMSRTDTGTATVELVDRTGDFDPTNPGGAFYGIGPMTQTAISLRNAVTGEWTTLFRGFIASIRWVPYQSEQHANVTLDLVDAMAFLAACEMAPTLFDPTEADSDVFDPPKFGDEVFEGNIVFHENKRLDAVRTRIKKVLKQAGWPPSLATVFTGNVGLCKTVYAPRTTVLSVIQDAADAEFPGTANFWIGGPSNTGELVFHGRFARFNPGDGTYNIRTWQAGDDQAAAGSPGTVVRISPPLEASLDDTLLYTSALATSIITDDGDIAAQYVTDIAAANSKGLRTWSAESLATRGGAALRTANEETKLFADYIRDNFATPKLRVGQLTVKARRPESMYAAATWAMLCGIDISDIVHLSTSHGGGGGFNDDFYVEGIHYRARPGGVIPYVELVLDVSPAGYYDNEPDW